MHVQTHTKILDNDKLYITQVYCKKYANYVTNKLACIYKDKKVYKNCEQKYCKITNNLLLFI